jgi:hypothetical protein
VPRLLCSNDAGDVDRDTIERFDIRRVVWVMQRNGPHLCADDEHGKERDRNIHAGLILDE